MNPTVDLVYFDGCPHVDQARDALRRALDELGLTLHWREWRTDDPALPRYAAGYGSPTVFVEGREVTGVEPAGSATSSCRLYHDANGERRTAPSVALVKAALAAQLG